MTENVGEAEENVHQSPTDEIVAQTGAQTNEQVSKVSKPLQPTCSCVQLANGLLSHSFIEELCKYIGSDSIQLQPLLSKGVGPSHGSHRKTQEGNRKRQFGPKDHEGGLSEELIESILSLIPFPSIFKARILNRSWFHKFPAQSVMPLRPSFHELISSVSSQWATYGPVYFTRDEILAFDRTSSQWKSIIPLSGLSGPFQYRYTDFFYRITIGGPLLCFINCFRGDLRDSESSLFVSNVITKRSRKLLDVPTDMDEEPHIRLLQVNSDQYKVLLVYPSYGESHVYDSILRRWTKKSFYSFGGKIFATSAYLKEKLYCLYIDEDDDDDDDSVLTLWTYQVQKDAWLMPIPLSFVLKEIRDCAVLVCEDRVMVAIWFQRSHVSTQKKPDGIEDVSNQIGLFQFDVDTLKLTEVCRGPPQSVCTAAFGGSQFCRTLDFGSDANFLYFCGNYDIRRERSLSPNLFYFEDNTFLRGEEFRVISYDIQTRVWSCLPPSPRHAGLNDVPWVGLPFQPGRSPFMSV